MAKSEARRQKQLAKKKAKRDEKRTELVRQTSPNPLLRLADAESWPVFEALVPEGLWDNGIGTLILARRQLDGRIAFAGFLVDTYCLGVKNAFWKIMSESDYREFTRKVERAGRLRKVAPEYLAKLVLESVAYAHSFGLPPHEDYRHARLLLQGIDPALCTETFEFGKDGKPLFIGGPHDSMEKMKVIAHKISQGGGDYLVPISLEEHARLMDADAPQQIGVDEE